MKRILYRSCMSAAVSVSFWHLILLTTGHMASLGDAWLDAGRVWPYSHASLNTGYLEGNYYPIFDPLFVFPAAARNCVAFCLGAITLGQVTTNMRWTFLLFAPTALVIYSVQFGVRFPVMTQALVIEAFFALTGVAIGIHIAHTKNQSTQPAHRITKV